MRKTYKLQIIDTMPENYELEESEKEGFEFNLLKEISVNPYEYLEMVEVEDE